MWFSSHVVFKWPHYQVVTEWSYMITKWSHVVIKLSQVVPNWSNMVPKLSHLVLKWLWNGSHIIPNGSQMVLCCYQVIPCGSQYIPCCSIVVRDGFQMDSGSSRVISGWFPGDSRVILGWFLGDSRVVPGWLPGGSRVIPRFPDANIHLIMVEIGEIHKFHIPNNNNNNKLNSSISMTYVFDACNNGHFRYIGIFTDLLMCHSKLLKLPAIRWYLIYVGLSLTYHP